MPDPQHKHSHRAAGELTYSCPEDTKTLQHVGDYMHEQALMLTTAESCTAGLIAAHLADLPGAGSILECAVVAYTPDAKKRYLGVSTQTLERFNLTSEQVAAEMAYGALSNSGANLAIANTGVSDDTDPDVPAGTQCFAWLFRLEPSAGHQPHTVRLLTETKRFDGDRNSIRLQAALYALRKIPIQHAQALAMAGRDSAFVPGDVHTQKAQA